jgi:hypothetical protein
MQKATQPQIAKLHVLLNNLGLIEQKAEIVYNLTSGRTQSTKELTIDEARRLITNLAQYDPNEKLKSLIFSLAYQADIIYCDTPEDKKMNAAKLNFFLKNKGTVKLELNEMNYKELVKTQRQFEAIARNVKKSQDDKQATAALNKLLNEMNLQVK